jgi:hypothetical protein
MEDITIEQIVESCTGCKHLGYCLKGQETGNDCLEDEIKRQEKEEFIEKVRMENEYGDFRNGLWHNY